MNINFQKIKKTFVNLAHNLPLIFARRVATIFVIGAVISLLIGGWFFYQNAYSLTVQEYEAFVKSRKVSTRLLEDALLYIEEQNEGSQPSISKDPFRP